MQTLNFNKDVLIQIHRNHVLTETLGDTCEIRLTSYLTETVVQIQANVQTLQNCYILTIQDSLTTLGMNARMELLGGDGSVIYTSDVFILHPAESDDITPIESM